MAESLCPVNRVLLHRPMPVEAYQALEICVQEALVAEIGVSNFSSDDLCTLNSIAKIRPCVNQVEFHPFVPGLHKLLTECRRLNIPLQAHTVLARGKFLSYPPLVALARRKNATPAQILLLFALSSGLDAVIHSSNHDHLSELIAAARGDCGRLSDVELAEMHLWSHAASGAPHIFYPRRCRVPPVVGISTSMDAGEYVSDIVAKLSLDFALLGRIDGASSKSSRKILLFDLSDIIHSLPTGVSRRAIREDAISHMIASQLFPTASHPLPRYIDTIKKLKTLVIERDDSLSRFSKAPSCSRRSTKSVGNNAHFQPLLNDMSDEDDKIDDQVANPTPMPVNVASLNDLVPFLTYISSSENLPSNSNGAQFVRGTVFSDGRMDMCKQVVGTKYIQQLCEAISKAPVGKVRHFLLGNNICCQEDAEMPSSAIASLIEDPQKCIETWYLAGNCIDEVAIKRLADAFCCNTFARSLWLKRNPIKASGAGHLANMLCRNSTLKLLDLHNTGLLDDGIERLLRPLVNHEAELGVEHLYIDANGITEIGAQVIASFIQAWPNQLETLYLSMNRIGDTGTIAICNALVDARKKLGHAPRLKRLSLSSCRMTHEGLQAAVKAAKACELLCLDVGYYKATRDMGERSNSFERPSVEVLQNLMHDAPSLRFLGVARCGLHDYVHELRASAHERGKLWLADGLDFNSHQACGGMSASEVRLGVRHPQCVQHIDSIYRGKS